ncbi:transmembrane protein 45B-like isoform X2 [Pithys albifrons albifrons]|uniref:transmembrane protein 45B-like isoform X2 n=1 Tax=Pithys albifrons albifrons TaxID=3385563 RepID=UPI003A5CBF28
MLAWPFICLFPARTSWLTHLERDKDRQESQVQNMSLMPTSFLGSALRGTFFFIFGLWWSVRYPLKYLRRKGDAEGQPSSGVQRAEIFEGAVKVFFALIGILVEQFVPTGPHLRLYSPETHSWTNLTHWHYSTIYLFFLLSGILDVVSQSRLKLPPGLDRLSLCTALLVEGLLFCFRGSRDAELDQHLHSLLAMAIFAGALCALLEVFLRDHIVLETFRASSFLLQGSWLWQLQRVVPAEVWGHRRGVGLWAVPGQELQELPGVFAPREQLRGQMSSWGHGGSFPAAPELLR